MTTIAPEVIERLESFEALADAARLVSADMDSGRWTLGDIANCCARKWGENTIGDLAEEIRIASRKTLYQYAQVSARFDVSTRVAYQDAPLTFSHFRESLRTKDDAELWLARAADESWSVREMHRQIAAAIGKPVPPVKLYDGAGVVWQYANESRPYLVLSDDVSQLKPNMRVMVKVYAVEEAANA